ncbi:MAG: EAL domain-containing protein [Microcoleaceae cyanobacterium MO_207.B10]|nr:EAL domain-containing protein [Microcoleaceae cyanobacterium MO_207.B10]
MNQKKCQDLTTNSSHSATTQNNPVSLPIQIQIDQLSETNQQTTTVGDNHDAVFFLDANGLYIIIASTNPANLYKPSAELLGKSLHQVFEQSIADSFLKVIQNVLATRKTVRVNYCLTIEEKQIWFTGSISPISDRLLVWVAYDLTERQETQTALQESQERWQLALQGAGDGIFDWNLKTDEVFYSTTWKAMLGYSESEIAHTAEQWLELVHPDDLDRVIATNRAHIEQKTSHYSSEYRMQCKDDSIIHGNGSIRWVYEKGQRVDDQDGKFLYVGGIILDITEHKQSEIALKDSEQPWQLALEGSNDCISDHNLQTNENVLSPRCLEMLGYDYAEINNFEKWSSLVHPDDLEVLLEKFEPHLKQETSHYCCEYWMLAKVRQLTSPDLIKQLEVILEKNNLSGNNFKLEITESCLLDSFEHQDLILQQIKNLGVKLSIDDFGTGYSSVSRLHELPIDTLKIERAFVKRIDANSDNTIILTIITLARILNMDLVAEGIETTLHRDILRDLGCEFGQGFLFPKPLEFQAATLMIQDFYEQLYLNIC